MAKKKTNTRLPQVANRKASSQTAPKASRKSNDSKKIPEWFVITELEQLKSVANPFRLKILYEFANEARTAKQVAQGLGEPPTKLYHHVDALASAGLLILVREEPKRGTTEKYFQAVARQFRVDQQCLCDIEFRNQKEKSLLKMLDDTRSGVIASINQTSDSSAQHPATAIGALIKTGPSEDLENVVQSLANVLDKAEAKSKTKKKSKPSQSYRIAIFIYPD